MTQRFENTKDDVCSDQSTVNFIAQASTDAAESASQAMNTRNFDPPKPLPLELNSGHGPSFPVEALGPQLAELAYAMFRCLQSPLNLIAMSLLAVITTIIQGRFNVGPIDGCRSSPCSGSFLSIARSGEGKSKADSRSFETLNSWQSACRKKMGFPVMEVLDEHGNSSESPKTLDGQMVYVDTTIPSLVSNMIQDNYPCVGLISDEGGQFFGGHSMSSSHLVSNLSVLTKAFDSGQFDRHRIGDPDGSGLAENRRLTLYLSIQPEVFRKFASNGLFANQGFFPRMLVTYPQSMLGNRTHSPQTEILEETAAYIQHKLRMKELLAQPISVDSDLGIVNKDVGFTQEAIDFYYSSKNELEAQLGPDGRYSDEKLHPFVVRKMQLACRVAVVLTAYHGQNKVSRTTLQGAAAIVQHSIDTWEVLLSSAEKAQQRAHAKELLDWLDATLRAHSGEIKLRDVVRNGPNKFRKDNDSLQQALTILADHYWISVTERDKSGGVKAFKLSAK